MTVLTCTDTGRSITLSKEIASSGEAKIWRTSYSGYLAKIYHSPTPERIEKLEVMISHPPQEPNAHQNHISFAWPQSILKNAQGDCVGFLMPEIKGGKELIDVYNPKRYQQQKLDINWQFLHVTAQNITSIIEAIHVAGYVLGDIKPQNILVNNQALPSIIDTDSFQVRHPRSGRIYKCLVGSEGYTPPELIGQDFSEVEQTEVHDHFRLAVIIYQLLFGGQKPFSGKWVGPGEPPEMSELVSRGLWLYGAHSLLQPVNSTIPLAIVALEIQQCFRQCFNDGYQVPNLRPSAQEWVRALKGAVQTLIKCGQVESHFYSQTYGKCYWCDRSSQLGVDIFPTVVLPTVYSPSPLVPPPSPPVITRGNFLKWLGWGSVGLVTAVVGAEISANTNQSQSVKGQGESPTTQPVSTLTPITVAEPRYIPPTAGGSKAFGLPLWTVKYETVTVDGTGQIIKRDSNKQAKFFKEDVGNGIILEMVSIPDGSLTMGSPPGEAERFPNEGPQHQVQVPGFFMGKYPVTQAQYQVIMGTNPAYFKGEKRPVETVSWDDAVEFCQRLSQKTGRTYRLPSEAEWEYACRAGTTTPFYFGETITTDLVNCEGNFPYAAAPKGEFRRQTTNVGIFPPNSFGLYDMCGNIWEWCKDVYHNNYKGAPTNGSAWLIGKDNNTRLVRGGSWCNRPKLCRSAYRGYPLTVDKYDFIGFRVVCSAA